VSVVLPPVIPSATTDFVTTNHAGAHQHKRAAV